MALAWRLRKGILIGWVSGSVVMGALFGSMAAGIGDVVGNSEQARLMFERMGGASGLVDVFLPAIAGVFGVIASMYGVQATLRMRSDETTLRLKPLLTTRVRRLQWTASHLVFSLLGSALLLAVSGLGAGLLHGLQVDDVRGDVPAVLGAVLAQLPAVWVVVGVAVLAFGFLLKHSVRVSWAAASMCLLVSLYGPVVRLPQPVLDIAVHAHPEVPECGVHAHPHGVADRHGRHRTFCGFGTFQRRDIG